MLSAEELLDLHVRLRQGLLAEHVVIAENVEDFISKANESSFVITDIEDRARISRAVRFWASYLASEGHKIPDIDFDAPRRTPAILSSKSTLATESHIARKEGAVVNLKYVVIVSIHPIVPGGLLRQVMIDNIANKGVRYVFLYSKGINDRIRYEFITGLTSLREEALGCDDPFAKNNDYIKTYELPNKWIGSPCIFYLSRRDNNLRYVEGLRGDTEGVPIAKTYKEMKAGEAHDLYHSIMGATPREVNPEIVDRGNVIRLKLRNLGP